MGFLENLNTSQLHAVQQEPSELLIFAGPGSGKTRVLTSRIAAFVLERGVLRCTRPNAICIPNQGSRPLAETHNLHGA